MTEIRREELIKHLSIDSDTLAEWTKEGLPVKTKGRGRLGNVYIVEDVEAWCTANNKKFGETKESLQEAKTRRETALATLAELELKELEGQLVRIEDISKEYEKQLINVRTRLLAIPSKVAGVVLGLSDINQVKDIIDKEIYAALEELSK